MQIQTLLLFILAIYPRREFKLCVLIVNVVEEADCMFYKMFYKHIF